MSCNDACAIIADVLQNGLPRIEGACPALESAIKTNEVTIHALYSFIEAHNLTVTQLSEANAIISKIVKDNDNLKREIERVSNAYNHIKSEQVSLLNTLRNFSDAGKVFDVDSYLNRNEATLH